MNNVAQIAQINAAANSAKFSLEKTTQKTSDSSAINIPTETFDLINQHNDWKGTVTLFSNGMVMIEKGGKYNWTERFNNIYAFKKHLIKAS